MADAPALTGFDNSPEKSQFKTRHHMRHFLPHTAVSKGAIKSIRNNFTGLDEAFNICHFQLLYELACYL